MDRTVAGRENAVTVKLIPPHSLRLNRRASSADSG
jgi:hypothetical protein